MTIRQAFYDYLKLLEGKKATREAEIERLMAKHSREPEKFWRQLAAYRDFRAGKTLLMIAAAGNSIPLSVRLIAAGADTQAIDSSGRNCAHYAAVTDAIEWLMFMYETRKETLRLHNRDATQQRPTDIAGAFGSFRVKRWLDMQQAADIHKLSSDSPVFKDILELICTKCNDPVAVFDHLAEMCSLPTPTRWLQKVE